jgi:predicted component of type VI protein secretion system
MQADDQRRREHLERLLADLEGRLDALLEALALAEQDNDADRYAPVAERARALAAELAALGDAADAEEQLSKLLLGALREAHQPLRESVLYERLLERGAAVSPEEFVSLAHDLATLGLVRVAVEHDLPARDPPPFQPRFYRPAT